MILANSSWGGWIAECGVPGIYRSQASLAPGVKVRMGVKPAPHAGMGVAQYTWATSPLRRYVDLVNQWQIIACARHGRTAALAAPFKPKDAALFSIISAFDAAYAEYNGFQSAIERYWTLRFLEQNGIAELDAAVMKDGLVRAETLPLVFRALGAEGLPRGARVSVKIGGTDLLTLDVHASVAGRIDDPATTADDAPVDEADVEEGGRKRRPADPGHRRGRRRRRAGAARRRCPLGLTDMARKRLRQFSTLQIALAFSVAVHAALLGVRFVDPEGFNRIFQDTPLEGHPRQFALRRGAVGGRGHRAKRNLQGGGEADRGRATSPLPPSATMELGDATEDSRRQVEQLQETQQQLLAQMRRELALMPPPDPQRDQGSPQERALEEKRRRLIELLAEIEKRINEENARPKKRYISPATREEVYALYYDQLRRKIEERGTRNFPEYQGKKLYGELVMNVTVDAEGRVIDTEVVRPSNSKILDRRAEAIVKAAAPFGPFTATMRRKADQLVITSRFKFTREEGLSTTLSAQ